MDVILTEPDGNTGIIVDKDYAIEFCATHPGWTWKELEIKASSKFDSEIPTTNTRKKIAEKK